MRAVRAVADLSGLQERIGHRFRDSGLLLTALTHISFAPSEPRIASY